VAESFTNYGSRMDVHAWGSSIVTTGYGDLHNEGPDYTWYTDDFGGTSGASPMIAGSALCLQGISRYYFDTVMTPEVVRQLLHDTGIPHMGTRYIGPRPDLEEAVTALLDPLTGVARTTLASGLRLTGVLSPFASRTAISFLQDRAGPARLSVYDVMGRRVRLLDLPAATGERLIRWDGRDGRGRKLGSGVYLFRIEAAGQAVAGRVVKVR
jgi:hypothetical protein